MLYIEYEIFIHLVYRRTIKHLFIIQNGSIINPIQCAWESFSENIKKYTFKTPKIYEKLKISHIETVLYKNLKVILTYIKIHRGCKEAEVPYPCKYKN